MKCVVESNVELGDRYTVFVADTRQYKASKKLVSTSWYLCRLVVKNCVAFWEQKPIELTM